MMRMGEGYTHEVRKWPEGRIRKTLTSPLLSSTELRQKVESAWEDTKRCLLARAT